MHDHFKVIAIGARIGGLYKLDVTRKIHQTLASQPWQHKLFHTKGLATLIIIIYCYFKKKLVEGIPLLKNVYSTCEGCALEKMYMEGFLLHLDRIKRDILELVNIDVCGPM